MQQEFDPFGEQCLAVERQVRVLLELVEDKFQNSAVRCLLRSEIARSRFGDELLIKPKAH